MPTAEIVYRDDSVIVVDKPAGLVVHSAPGHRGETLVDQLAGFAAGGPRERPGIVHRIDKDTSGLLVVAASVDAHRDLARQVQHREMGREYLALVEGRVGSRSGTIDAPVGRDHRSRERMAVGGRRQRKARTHQIRTHFAAIGHPVCGDPRYGHGSRYGLTRQFLHARRLTFRHPATGQEITFTSELPAELTAALELARGASCRPREA